MKKQILALLLSLTLCVSLLPAAFAEGEAPTFSDVPAGSWFEQGVKSCAEQGVMVGTGEGVFSPNAELSQAECLTLAYRLYDMAYGGDGSLLKAPEGWGYLKIETDDGKLKHEGFSGDRNVWDSAYVRHEDTTRLNLRPKDSEMLNTFIDYYYPPQGATVTLDGVEYRGTVQWVREIAYVTYYLVFTPEDESVNELLLSSTDIPAGDKWWRDLSYTLQERDLEEVFFYGPSEAAACRYTFAYLLYAAIGEQLEPLREAIEIPDLPRDEDNEHVYRLYEAGILSGVDESGTFEPNKTLTRAEAATMVARVLDPTLRIGAGNAPATPSTQPPASNMTTAEVEVEVNRDFTTYDAAVADLRSKTGHHNEKIYETPDCDIYVFDRGGFMNAPHGMMVAIYKKGSALGEGATLTLPFARAQTLMVCTPADTMALSADKRSFTYTYTFDEELLFENVPVRGKGTFTYVFDIPSGKVTLTGPAPSTVSYADALAKVTNEEGFTVEKTYESPYCTIVLGYYTLTGGMKDYAMYYVYKAADTNASDTSEGAIRQETLSYTNSYVDDPATGHVRLCTDRAPDTLVLSKDGSTLFFSYDLGSGPLTELTGGGPVTTARDLVNGYYSSGYTLEKTVDILSRGAVVEKKLESEYAVALLVYDQPHGVRDYALYLINKDTGLVRWCILPSTQVITLSDGGTYAPTTLAPNRMTLTDAWRLDYDYRFDAPLGDYHDAGLYSYFAHSRDNHAYHYSGQYDRAFEEYWLNDGQDTVILFETAECSVLQSTSRPFMLPAPPSTTLSLLYKAGSAMGEGIRIVLPKLKYYPDYDAVGRHDSRYNPPHSTALSDDGKTLTYTYKVQWPVTDYRYEGDELVEYVEIPTGTYTYSVELSTGEWSQSYLAE